MAQSNYNSNDHNGKFYIVKSGLATCTMVNNVYTLNTAVASDRFAEIRIKIMGVTIGDIVTIEADVNGVGNITAALLDTVSETGVVKHAVPDINGMTKTRSTFVVPKEGDIRLVIGSGYNLDFVGTIQNIAVTVQSESGAYAFEVNGPIMQRFTIQTTATGTFSLRSDWSLNTGVLETLDTNTLKLTLDNKPARRYQVFTNLMSQAGSVLYYPRVDIDSNNLVTIKFYNTSGTVVALSAVAHTTCVGILLY